MPGTLLLEQFLLYCRKLIADTARVSQEYTSRIDLTEITTDMCPFRFLCLGLGLLYLGKQEKADVMLEAVRTVEHKRGRYAEITLNTCAYAGTGNVLKVHLIRTF